MNVVIIEDEPLAAERLASLVQQYDKDARIVAMLPSVSSAVAWFSENPAPDILFSDIRLSDGVSFDVFSRVKISCPVIFTTAYDEYAIQAFDVHSVAYLLKPIKYASLAKSLDKWKENINIKTIHSPSTPTQPDWSELLKAVQNQQIAPSYKSRFLVKYGQKIKTVKVEEVAYFYSKEKLTLLVAQDGGKYPLDQTLDQLAEQLSPDLFFRVNRSLIVHIEAVKEIHTYFKGRLKLDLAPALDEEVVVSSERTPMFKAWLDK